MKLVEIQEALWTKYYFSTVDYTRRISIVLQMKPYNIPRRSLIFLDLYDWNINWYNWIELNLLMIHRIPQKLHSTFVTWITTSRAIIITFVSRMSVSFIVQMFTRQLDPERTHKDDVIIFK